MQIFKLPYIHFLLICLLPLTAIAQSSSSYYANEWINYNQSYYKVKVGDDALYRISFDALQKTDLPLSADGFQLFHNGEQVPLYVSSSENLTGEDYIEFYGRKNDGRFDSRLYQEENGQLNPYKSLFNDTSTYYLTWNNTAQNLRVQDTENDVSAFGIAEKETFFMHEVLLMPDKKNQSVSRFSRGKPTMLAFRSARSTTNEADILSPYNYADFERGEGLVDSIIDNSFRKYGMPTPALFKGSNAPMAELEVKVVGRNDDTMVNPDHHIRVNVKNIPYLDKSFDGYETPDYTFPIAASDIDNKITQIVVESVGDLLKAPEDDWQSVAYLKLRYPRTFDFKPYIDNDFINSNQFVFELTHNNISYIEIEGFSGGSNPVVYDLTNHLRLIPNIKNGKYRIALPAGTNVADSRKLVISATEEVFNDLSGRDDIIKIMNDIERVRFTDFKKINNQGDFILVYNPQLVYSSADFDQFEGYAKYRRSEDGGSHKVVTVSIEELYDQFASGIKTHPLSIRNFVNYAVDKWTIKPEYMLLVGKSIDYRDIALDPLNNYHKCLIPSYGSPPSDNMLTARDASTYLPQLKIGRIPAQTIAETFNYMNKVTVHEEQQRNPACTKEERLWMKRVLHPFQASNNDEGLYVVNNVMNPLKQKIENSTYGAHSQRFAQIGTNDASNVTKQYNQMVEKGAALVTYWGHLDGNWRWQFDIWKASEYDSTGRFAFFAPICDHAGQIHKRMTGSNEKSQAEEYILERRAGAIGYLAGVSYYEDFEQTKDFHIRFYDLLSNQNYGHSVGASLHQWFEESIASATPENEPYIKLIAEHLTYVGDPTICLFAGDKADYVVEEEDIQIINPNNGNIIDKVTPFMSEFTVKVTVSNLGKASNDSIELEVVRTLTDGTQINLASKKVLAPPYQQAYYVNVANDIFEGDGINEISVSIDQKDKISESCEDNNFSKKTLQIEGNCEMSETVAAVDNIVVMDDQDVSNLSMASIGENYTFEWSNGSTENAIEVTEQGIYTVNITDDLGCNVEKTFKVYPNDLVYPGDANYDGTANMYDLLSIGLGYNFEGELREDSDIYNWDGQLAFDWDTEIVADALNAKHSDCNGNGIINSDDVTAIKANYHQTVDKTASTFETYDAALYVEAVDTIIPGYEHVFSVNLGTENKPAEGIYGIAFTAEFTLAELGEDDTIQLNAPMATYGNSWLGVKGQDMLTLDTIMNNTLLWDVALTRTNHENRTSYGALCNLGCVMVIGSLKSAGQREVPINLTLKNVVVTRADGSKVQLKSTKRTFVIADPVVTGIEDVANTFALMTLSPNPANSLVYLDFKGYQPQETMTQIHLYDLAGQLLISQQKAIRNNDRVTLDIADLPEGMYWVQMVNGNAQVTKKLLIAK
ncbi:MAG: C25 family cysteine peptidase [Chitinophagales bacterium]